MSAPAIKPTLTLPTILAIVGGYDGGPCENGEPTAHCPHCGAGGRYVISFLCDDGTIRGAMRGCIQLFPKSSRRESKLAMEAYSRRSNAIEDGKKLASWWAEMIAACEALGAREIDLGEWSRRIFAAESNRQSWLRKNGYGRGGRRGGSSR